VIEFQEGCQYFPDIEHYVKYRYTIYAAVGKGCRVIEVADARCNDFAFWNYILKIGFHEAKSM
jgi:hypothetical protein